MEENRALRENAVPGRIRGIVDERRTMCDGPDCLHDERRGITTVASRTQNGNRVKCIIQKVYGEPPCTAAKVLQQISECKTKEKEFIRQAAEQEKKIETMKETDPSRYAQCKAALETLTHQVLDKTRRTFRFLVMIMEPSGHSRGGGVQSWSRK